MLSPLPGGQLWWWWWVFKGSVSGDESSLCANMKTDCFYSVLSDAVDLFVRSSKYASLISWLWRLIWGSVGNPGARWTEQFCFEGRDPVVVAVPGWVRTGECPEERQKWTVLIFSLCWQCCLVKYAPSNKMRIWSPAQTVVWTEHRYLHPYSAVLRTHSIWVRIKVPLFNLTLLQLQVDET